MEIKKFIHRNALESMLHVQGRAHMYAVYGNVGGVI